ncbi:hypothetical protein AAG570_013289 [Ranatra chinensis]|uniref:Integrase catalytic domain-containing protein n=1 Tax=Ranatra chinensis TaxID=642074 RepID=A0ABD0YGB5_9HEMI
MWGRQFLIKTNHRPLVRSLLEEFRIRVHWTTPGHLRTHSMIDRLHGTLQENLHLLRIGRGIIGEEVWSRSLLVYNSSPHTATGHTLLELLRAPLYQSSMPVGPCQLVDQNVREKKSKVERVNDSATDWWNRVQIGHHIFVKNWYRRRKTDPMYNGSYVVDRKLPRYRLRLRCEHTGRVRVFHANEGPCARENSCSLMEKRELVDPDDESEVVRQYKGTLPALPGP